MTDQPEVMYFNDILDDKIIEIARNDPKQIIEEFFFIVNKDGERVQFKFNDAQNEYYKDRTARDDILKARKEGFSSMILAILAVKFLFLENVSCVSISHEDEATKRLFEKVEYYIDNMEYRGILIKINISDRSNKRLRFRERNSSFYIGTAGSKAFGRGDTIHYLHVSETAFWLNASKVLTGLLNAVPDNPDNTYIVKESTANGFGNQHHTEWVNEKEGRSTFKPHFFGWHQDPTNRKKPEPGFRLTDDEKKLAIIYNLDITQIVWRRWKMQSMQPDETHTKEELFMQEFPITDDEAFLSSGKPVFDLKLVEIYEEMFVKNPEKTGEMMGWKPAIFIDDPNGRVKLWADPVKGHTYCIGADVAESHDYCYASVIDRATCEQVGEVRCHTDEFEFAGILFRLGMFFYEALIGVERNNQGVAVVKKLDELGYINQYVRESIDEITQRVSNELGWRTDARTRPIMISEFNQFFTNRAYKFRSKVLATEMRTFVRNSKGRPEAQANCHDDAVIGNCIAIQMYKNLPEPIKDDKIIARDYVPNHSAHSYRRHN